MLAVRISQSFTSPKHVEFCKTGIAPFMCPAQADISAIFFWASPLAMQH